MARPPIINLTNRFHEYCRERASKELHVCREGVLEEGKLDICCDHLWGSSLFEDKVLKIQTDRAKKRLSQDWCFICSLPSFPYTHSA